MQETVRIVTPMESTHSSSVAKLMLSLIWLYMHVEKAVEPRDFDNALDVDQADL